MLLKEVQSALESWPVLTKEEVGKFRVKVLPEIEPLKMLPVVPVASVVTTEEETEMVEVPDRLMPVPAFKRVLMSEKLGAEAPLLLKSWKVVPTKVDLKVEPS